MSVTTQEKNPSLAEIVRQETDGGRTIVQFYIGVADGTLDGFRDNHRMAAARRLDKIAPGLVREYLRKYHNAQVRESMRGSLFPMGPTRSMKKPARSEPVQRGPNRFQRRLAQLVRKETGDGRTIYNFLNGVMHGTFIGFQPYHRLEASKELSTYLDPSAIPAEAGFLFQEPSPIENGGAARDSQTPSPSTGADRVEGDSPIAAKSETQRNSAGHTTDAKPGPDSVRPEPVLSPVEGPVEEPAPYSIRGQYSAERPPSPSTGEGDSPAAANSRTQRRSGARPSQSSQSPNHTNQSSDNPAAKFPPITVEELEQNNFDPSQIARYNFARDEITGSIFAFDHISPIVMDDDGTLCRVSPDRVVGYERAARAVEDHDRAPRTAHTRPPGGSTRTRNRRRKNPNTLANNQELTTNSRPHPPGRSPPKIWV